jgi:ribosome-binding factor A
MGTIKQQRTAEQIRLIISELLHLEVSDPRVQGVTVTRVTIDREFQHADIFVNALGDDSREGEMMEGLNHAQSYLRRELSQRVQLRKVPQLHFRWDASLQNVEEINSLLDGLVIPPEPEPEPEAALPREEDE